MSTVWCRIFGHAFISHVRWAGVVLVCQHCGKVVDLGHASGQETRAAE